MAKEIPLNHGFAALIDDEDFERASQYVWRVIIGNKKGATTYYAANYSSGHPVFLHNFILGNDNKTVRYDHKNRNGLDNRKENLRPATFAQNMCNRRSWSRSGFKGVWKKGNRYRAEVRLGKVRISIGYFMTAEEAARAYDVKAKELHGEFAVLNFPEETENPAHRNAPHAASHR